MTRRSLTPKPSVPALVRIAAIGTLSWAPLACGDDGNNDSNTSDQFPTDACIHSPESPGCQTTGDVTATEADDVAPTIPCAHDSGSCETSTGPDGTTGTTVVATDTDSATDTDAGTDTDTGTGGSSSGTTGGA